MIWTGLFIWACIVHNAEACFEDGEFYCAKLWYFWFVVFFIFVFILIAAIITTNLCTKKKRRVGAKGGGRGKSKRRAANKKRESRASILSKATSDTTTRDGSSPQVSSKFPAPAQSNEGDRVASKRFFTVKDKQGQKALPTSNKATTRDIVSVENGENASAVVEEKNCAREGILTTRDLPASLVMELDETGRGDQDDGKAADDNTTC